jgi:small basic protein (TIGR04137 family)
MTIHKSLLTRGKLARHRNVLTRAERVTKLLEEERWKEGDSIFGLPKVRHLKMKARKKAKKAEATSEAAAAAPAEGAAAPAAAAPAAAAVPAKAAKPAAAAKEKPGKK